MTKKTKTKGKTTKRETAATTTAADQALLDEYRATVDRLQSVVDKLQAGANRLLIENAVLREGCALIREEAINRAPSTGFATRLTETIFKVMRDDGAMKTEVDRRIADPRRSWWIEKDKEMFPASSGGSPSGG